MAYNTLSLDETRSEIEYCETLRKAYAALQNQLINVLPTIDADNPLSTGRTLKRIEVQVSDVEILGWLENQPFESKVYWRGRDGEFEVAGIEISDQIKTAARADVFRKLDIRLKRSTLPIRYYGHVIFHENCLAEEWQPFGVSRFILPSVELYRNSRGVFLACIFFLNSASIYRTFDILESLNPDPQARLSELLTPLSRRDLPGFATWQENVSAALESFEKSLLKKVVLSRKTDFHFSHNLTPLSILKRLKSSSPAAFHFCFQLNEHNAFLGASPERLYSRQHSLIKTEALAGTRPRGATLSEDAELKAQLLNSEKDLREHRFVVDEIQNNLQTFCSTTDIDDQFDVLQLSRVQHLLCRMQGVLQEKVNDGEIIASLHPTPAVGGFPKQTALNLIQEIEPFDRGLFAAPVGWVAKDAAEFAVGIRSGLAQKNKLSLFAGAGIVAGSNSAAEWSEIENKMNCFVNATMSV